MPHSHQHDTENLGDGKLMAAVVINVLLTVAQVIGGIISGSLSLIADALHNLSDAASLGIAIIARKIGRRPADELKTFGYKRAEVIAALINLTTLIIIGVYLIYEALWRLAEPQEIAGWLVVIVASIALVVDVVTALLTYAQSKNSMNIKAAFLHNLSDALASLAEVAATGGYCRPELSGGRELGIGAGRPPVVEELLFRGLVLRGLMLRLGFWPAALLSSAVFGLLHATAGWCWRHRHFPMPTLMRSCSPMDR